MSIQTFH